MLRAAEAFAEWLNDETVATIKSNRAPSARARWSGEGLINAGHLLGRTSLISGMSCLFCWRHRQHSSASRLEAVEREPTWSTYVRLSP
jgi:hypothetical protein